MIKTFIFALLGLAVALLVILTSSPAPAQSPDPATYAWEYLKPGSDRLVCQRISLRVKSLPPTKTTRAQPIHTRSQVVSDRFCAGFNQANNQSPVTSNQFLVSWWGDRQTTAIAFYFIVLLGRAIAIRRF